ncbi:MAG: protein kinase, partial [Chloroflexota bacterium]
LKPTWMSDPKAVERFKQEARIARKLRHPHIIDVYDVGEAGGKIYLTQLLIEGETLGQRIARQPLSWSETVQIITDIGSALDYAHSQGVVHRDIKPANILLGADNQAYLGDFGLVRAMEGSTHLSSSTSMIGTGRYMAPEIWDGQKATPATDVYAFSCVIFEMLTGKVLFEGSSMMAVMKKHVDGPQFPVNWPPDVPKGVTEILQQGLAENLSERMSNADDLAAALAALSTSQVTPDGASATKQPAKRTSSWLWMGIAAIVLLIIVGVAFFTLNGTGNDAGNSAVVVATSTTTPTQLVATEPTATPQIDTEATIAAAVAATEQTKGETQPEADTEATIAAAVEATTTEQAQVDVESTLAALSATATKQGESTSTPIPPTDTATPKPVLPSDTPTPQPTDTPSSSDNNATPEPLITNSPAVTSNSSVPELLSPAHCHGTCNVYRDRLTTFEWKVDDELSENTTFEVRIWAVGASHTGWADIDIDHYGAHNIKEIQAEYKGDGVYQISFDVSAAYAVQQHLDLVYFAWTVAIVQIDPYERIGLEAEPTFIQIQH